MCSKSPARQLASSLPSQHPLRPPHAPPPPPSSGVSTPHSGPLLACNFKLGHERAGARLSARMVVGRPPNHLCSPSTTKAARTQLVGSLLTAPPRLSAGHQPRVSLRGRYSRTEADLEERAAMAPTKDAKKLRWDEEKKGQASPVRRLYIHTTHCTRRRMAPLLLLLLLVAASRAMDDLEEGVQGGAPVATTAPLLPALGAVGGSKGRGREAISVTRGAARVKNDLDAPPPPTRSRRPRGGPSSPASSTTSPSVTRAPWMTCVACTWTALLWRSTAAAEAARTPARTAGVSSGGGWSGLPFASSAPTRSTSRRARSSSPSTR